MCNMHDAIKIYHENIEAKVNDFLEIRKVVFLQHTGKLILPEGLKLIESTIEPPPTLGNIPVIGIEHTEVYRVQAETTGEFKAYYLYFKAGEELTTIEKYVVNVKD